MGGRDCAGLFLAEWEGAGVMCGVHQNGGAWGTAEEVGEQTVKPRVWGMGECWLGGFVPCSTQPLPLTAFGILNLLCWMMRSCTPPAIIGRPGPSRVSAVARDLGKA